MSETDSRINVFLGPSNHALSQYCEEYKKLLDKIENVKNRNLPPDRETKLLTNLDLARRRLHDDAANDIKEHQLSQFGASEVKVDTKSAKLLFEVIYNIWDNPRIQHGFVYSSGELDGIDLEELKKRVRVESGKQIKISVGGYNFHNGNPIHSYTIECIEAARPEDIQSIKATVDRVLREHQKLTRLKGEIK